jgi:hypothetical protein
MPFLAVQLGGRAECEDDIAASWYHENKVDANACVPQDPSCLLRKLIKQGSSALAVQRLVSVSNTMMSIHRRYPAKL